MLHFTKKKGRFTKETGLELSEQGFRTLLAMRKQTDQMLLHREGI